MPSKRIVISGYYGFSNAGDEAVLAAIVSGIRASQNDVEITVLSASPDETSKLYGVRALPRYSMTEVKQALRECDLLISGGGSLIQDATSVQSLVYYLGVIWLAEHYRRKVMVLAQGIGPLRRGLSRRLASRVLQGVDLITVRDDESANLLRELGINGSKVHVTADPTFTLQPCSDEEAQNLLLNAGLMPGEEVVAISLREWPESPEIESAAEEALRSLSGTFPARLMLIAMHIPDDLLLAKRLAEKVPGLAVQPEAWTPERILGVLNKCSLVVGMRLHALIFAASVGVPSVGISYDPKVESFLSSAGQERISLQGITPLSLAEGIVHAWKNRDSLSNRLAEAVPNLRQAAAENFERVSQLLDR